MVSRQEQQCIMVRLTMTPAIVRALEFLGNSHQLPELTDSDPSLDEPAVGKPVSHEQIIAISKHLKQANKEDHNGTAGDTVACHLDDLLRGSRVYIEPPKPEQEPVLVLRSFVDNIC